MKTLEIPVLASSDFTCRYSRPSIRQFYSNWASVDVSAPLILWSAAESGVTIMAASIPVLRTLFRDLNTKSRKYYNSTGSKTATTTQGSRPMTKYGDNNLNTIVVSAGMSPYTEDVTKSSNSSDKSPVRDSYGHITQSTEIMVAVEYRKGDNGYDVARAL